MVRLVHGIAAGGRDRSPKEIAVKHAVVWIDQKEARIFEVEPNVRLLAHCRWQKDRHSHPTMLLAHGLEGASTSVYMLGTAEKAYRAGFNVVRLNFRTCGRTEHLTPTLYHAGMTGDLRAILCELIEKDQLAHILMVG